MKIHTAWENATNHQFFLHFSSLSAVDCLLLSNLGLWILSSAQGKVHDCCSLPSLWALCSPREHCSAGHTHLQLAPLNKLKQPAAFLRAALLSPQPVSNPFLCSLSPEMAALNSSGSTLQTTELKCPSNKRADNTGIYCLPWLLIFVLAFTL